MTRSRTVYSVGEAVRLREPNAILQAAYSAAIKEEIPDRFKRLLDRL